MWLNINMTKISNSSSPESFFFQVQNSLKSVFGAHWGSLPRSSRPLSRMERGIINYYLARERKFQGTKVPGSESSWNFRSRERKFQGAKVPWSESSWNFRSRERKFHTMVLSLPGAKVLRSESSCYPTWLYPFYSGLTHIWGQCGWGCHETPHCRNDAFANSLIDHWGKCGRCGVSWHPYVTIVQVGF